MPLKKRAIKKKNNIGKIVQINSEFRRADGVWQGGISIIALCDDGSLWFGRNCDSGMNWKTIETPIGPNIKKVK